MRAVAAGLALAALALLTRPWLSPAPPASPAPPMAVRVADETGGRTIAVLPVAGESLLQLRYVHSIYRQPAVEEFAVRPDGLHLVRLASPSAAVLEYYARPEPISQTEEGYQIRLSPPERHPRLALLASEVGQRTVVYAGRALPLHTLAAPGHRISLSLIPSGAPRP